MYVKTKICEYLSRTDSTRAKYFFSDRIPLVSDLHTQAPYLVWWVQS